MQAEEERYPLTSPENPVLVPANMGDPVPEKKKPQKPHTNAEPIRSSAQLAKQKEMAESSIDPPDVVDHEALMDAGMLILPTNAMNMSLPPNIMHVYVANDSKPRHYNDAIVGKAVYKCKDSMQKE